MPQVTIHHFGQPKVGVRVSAAEVAPGATLEALLASLAQGGEPGKAFAGQAVLLNGQSVAREAWTERYLEEGDVIAIIPMLVGG